MRIVFWGSERESCVTSNMLILASYLVCKKGYRITLLELAEEKCALETYFSKNEEQYVKSYLHTLIRGQLYNVSMDEWLLEGEVSIVNTIRYLETNMDMVFINLANRTDEEARSLMHNAGLLIVNMKQNFHAFDRYYSHYVNFSARVLMVIGNYYEDGNCEKKHLQERYDILEEQLAVIPNNPEYQMACNRSRVERYMRRDSVQFMSTIKRQFLKEVEKTAEQILEKCLCR